MARFGRKGQGAMEYLMTYSWAILVVMLVGIVMWQMGLFSMGSGTLTSTGFGKIKPQLAATKLSTDGFFLATFSNGAGTTAIVDLINVTDTQKSNNNNCVNKSVQTILPGENFQATCKLDGYPGKQGDVYIAQVTIGYNITIGGQVSTHKDTGTIRGQLEAV
ncbi:Uncharacterised protein [uncultured archaeon]|nr:Uncharacterised protein [uncultured archaeon]